MVHLNSQLLEICGKIQTAKENLCGHDLEIELSNIAKALTHFSECHFNKVTKDDKEADLIVQFHEVVTSLLDALPNESNETN